MTYKIERKGRRWGLYVLYSDRGWLLHQTYLTLKGAQTAALILYERGIFRDK